VQHYGLAIVSAVLGRLVALRQIGLHVCPEFPTFGEPVFGFDLYVWSFLVFTSSIFSCAVLTIINGYSKKYEYLPSWETADKVAFWAVGLITFGNAVTTFIECGFFSSNE